MLLQCPEGEQEGQHKEGEQGLLLPGADHRAGTAGGNGRRRRRSGWFWLGIDSHPSPPRTPHLCRR